MNTAPEAELRVLGVITARGGSKGVPRKNIRDLGGTPLIAHTVAAALGSALLTDVIVSTEDEEIAAAARAAGAQVPWMRPAELAQDKTPHLPVLQHALAAMEAAGAAYDYVLTLQPTSPFRSAEDIDEAVRIAAAHRPSSVVALVRIDEGHPTKAKRLDDGRVLPYFAEHPEVEGLRRQDLAPAFRRNGAIYLTRRDVLVAGSIYGEDVRGFEMPMDRSVDINNLIDFAVAEAVWKQKHS